MGIAKQGGPKLVITVPCYNEDEILDESLSIFSERLSSMKASGTVSQDSSILIVDDGSSDSTWEIARKVGAECEHVHGISLSKNSGHQAAIFAGMLYAFDVLGADIAITVDADIQDDLGIMDRMVEEYVSGAGIVSGVRNDRATDTFFKRATAGAFYSLCSFVSGTEVRNSADYRLVSRDAFEEICRVVAADGGKLFLRGQAAVAGAEHAYIEYARGERIGGTPKYTMSKMASLAIEGLSFYIRHRKGSGMLGSAADGRAYAAEHSDEF